MPYNFVSKPIVACLQAKTDIASLCTSTHFPPPQLFSEGGCALANSTGKKRNEFSSINPRRYQLIQTPTVAQGGRGRWEPLLVFVLLRQSELNLHWLDNPELTLQDDTILVGYDNRWRRHHGFQYLKKKLKNKDNWHLNQTRRLTRCTDSWLSAISWKKKLEKKYRFISKKLIFGQTFMEFVGFHGNVKNLQSLKVSAP